MLSYYRSLAAFCCIHLADTLRSSDNDLDDKASSDGSLSDDFEEKASKLGGVNSANMIAPVSDLETPRTSPSWKCVLFFGTIMNKCNN